MLDYLRSQDYLSKDTCWTAYTYLFAGITNTPKGIAKARCFKKETKKGDFTLNFHYNKDNDVFIVYILSALERDPPPGTSWPELYFN
ncbi:MAG: hypothetical protein J6C29_03900 [Clostridia bacterium]|nr:hypothetical protein [Clostridia bacterium]